MPEIDEMRDDFLSRCAGDETMAAEYPDGDQRLAVCGNIYDKKEEMSRAMFSIASGVMPSRNLVAKFRENKDDKTYTWDAEVFAVGTWNGYTFTEKDLSSMVESFNELNGGGYLEAPLKFGHNDEQPMTDGHPALGWITKLYIQKDEKGRDKLMATFESVPDVVYNAVKSGRYRKVSIELEFDVKHKGKMYPYVLTGVALLGADLPAVNTLADLTAYMGRDPLVAAKRASFSAVNGNIKEDRKMAEIDDKELADLRAAAARTAELDKKVADFAKAQKADAVKKARDSVNGKLDEAVKGMQITPAQRAAFSKMLRVDDDEAVCSIAPEDIEALLPAKQEEKKTFSRNDDSGDGSTDDKLDLEAKKIIAANGGKMTYSRALELAMSANPDAAKQHLGIE